MGQQMPPVDIEYGVNCLHCFPSGKTPKYMYARFINVVRCTGVGFETCHIPPNDRVFKLTQVVGTPCSWYYLSALWNVYYSAWRVLDGKSRLKIEDDLSRGVFEETTDSCQPEGFVWHNTLHCVPGTTCGLGGIAVITWTPQATQLLKDMVIDKSTDLFMELFPRADGKLVYKFCRLEDATSIKFLFDPQI